MPVGQKRRHKAAGNDDLLITSKIRPLESGPYYFTNAIFRLFSAREFTR
jgi:hypothetical protein